MAILTRKKATDIARFVKGKEEYTVAVVSVNDFKELKFILKEDEGRAVKEAVRQLKRQYKDQVVVVTGTEMRKHYAYLNTIKDLEVVFYQLINRQLLDLQSKYEKREKMEKRQRGEDYETQVGDIFYVNIGYNSQRYRFYKVVRTTAKSTEFVRVGKRIVSGDHFIGSVLPIPEQEEADTKILKRGRGRTLKYDNYRNLYVWSGQEMDEYSD